MSTSFSSRLSRNQKFFLGLRKKKINSNCDTVIVKILCARQKFPLQIKNSRPDRKNLPGGKILVAQSVTDRRNGKFPFRVGIWIPGGKSGKRTPAGSFPNFRPGTPDFVPGREISVRTVCNEKKCSRTRKFGPGGQISSRNPDSRSGPNFSVRNPDSGSEPGKYEISRSGGEISRFRPKRGNVRSRGEISRFGGFPRETPFRGVRNPCSGGFPGKPRFGGGSGLHSGGGVSQTSTFHFFPVFVKVWNSSKRST